MAWRSGNHFKIPVQFPDALWREAQALAEREHRSMTNLIKEALREYIAAFQK